MVKDSDKIEVYGVTKVSELVNNESELVSNFTTCDKIPLFDGTIRVYDSSDHTTHSVSQSINVQIKTRSVTKFSKNRVSFQVTKTIAQSYYLQYGLLFFIVQILGSEKNQKKWKFKIYCASLPVFQLYTLLSENNKKNIQFDCYEVQLDGNSILSICRKFLDDNRKQMSLFANPEIIHTDFSKMDRISCSVINDGKGFPDILFQKPECLYGHLKDVDMVVPISYLTLTSIKQKISSEVFIGSTKISDSFDYTKTYGGSSITITDCIWLEQNPKKKSSYLHFKNKGEVNSYKRNLQLLLEMLNGKCLSIGSDTVNIKKHGTTKTINQFKGKLYLVDCLLKILKYCNNQEPVHVESISPQEWNNVIILSNGFFNNTPVSLMNNGIPCMTDIQIPCEKIGEAIICFFAKKNGEGYCISNLEQHEWDSLIPNVPNIPIYVLLQQQIYEKATNLDYTHLVSSIRKCVIRKENVNALLFSGLRMILGFDQQTTKKSSLLDAAESIFGFICEFATNNNDVTLITIVKLNIIQVHVRKSELTDEEIKFLNQLMLDSTIDSQYGFGASVLLKQNKQILTFWNRMNEEDKKSYVSLPIFNLIDKDTKQSLLELRIIEK